MCIRDYIKPAIVYVRALFAMLCTVKHPLKEQCCYEIEYCYAYSALPNNKTESRRASRHKSRVRLATYPAFSIKPLRSPRASPSLLDPLLQTHPPPFHSPTSAHLQPCQLTLRSTPAPSAASRLLIILPWIPDRTKASMVLDAARRSCQYQ